MIGRDFEIVQMGGKGKNKTPVLKLESPNGEKMEIKLSGDTKAALSHYEFGQCFRVELRDLAEHRKTLAAFAEQDAQTEAKLAASKTCALGVTPEEYGKSASFVPLFLLGSLPISK